MCFFTKSTKFSIYYSQNLYVLTFRTQVVLLFNQRLFNYFAPTLLIVFSICRSFFHLMPCYKKSKKKIKSVVRFGYTFSNQSLKMSCKRERLAPQYHYQPRHCIPLLRVILSFFQYHILQVTYNFWAFVFKVFKSLCSCYSYLKC